jgi:hypothetical protein
VAAVISSFAEARPVALAAAAGAVGAWASILSRAAKLVLETFETPTNLQFQGVTRILLGTTFGVVAIVAIKTGQLFPSAADNIWATTLTTFVSGWSERLVPEIIGKFEARETNEPSRRAPRDRTRGQ